MILGSAAAFGRGSFPASDISSSEASLVARYEPVGVSLTLPHHK